MPSRGVISHEGDVEILTVYIFVEPYRSGARVLLRLRFCSDHPYEVAIATFTQQGSADLSTCIVTATMGNFARLRILHLSDGLRTASGLWPDFSGNGFAQHACYCRDDLLTALDGSALFVATPDEENPEDANYASRTFIGWKYYGEVATQYWRHAAPPLELRGCVNGRETYWASESPIPGGIAFENFELIEPFHEGVEAWFGVSPGFYERPLPISQMGNQ